MRLTLALIEASVRQRVPVYEIFGKNYDFSGIVDTESQVGVLNVLKDVPNRYYVQLFLQKFIRLLEQENQETEEDLYTFYCSPEIIQATRDPTALDSLSYKIGDDFVLIQESPNIISGSGTTGARTWEAALYLTHILQKYPLQGTICELGAGTGLVGISLLKTTNNKVILTDGESSLLEPMKTNISLSGVTDNFHIQRLFWGEDEAVECDYVVAADILYDNSIINDLIQTLIEFFGKGCKQCLIAATLRNPDTLREWEQKITQKFNWDFLDRCEDPATLTESSGLWFKAGTQPISIYRLQKLV